MPICFNSCNLTCIVASGANEEAERAGPMRREPQGTRAGSGKQKSQRNREQRGSTNCLVEHARVRRKKGQWYVDVRVAVRRDRRCERKDRSFGLPWLFGAGPAKLPSKLGASRSRLPSRLRASGAIRSRLTVNPSGRRVNERKKCG